MIRAVFDASVLVKLVVPESGSVRVADLYRRCESPIAPTWAMIECAQALWMKVRRGEQSAVSAHAAYQALASMELELVEEEDTAFVLALALNRDHPVYDCAYVALAHAENVPLVTADRRLRAVAESAAVEVVWVGSE